MPKAAAAVVRAAVKMVKQGGHAKSYTGLVRAVERMQKGRRK